MQGQHQLKQKQDFPLLSLFCLTTMNELLTEDAGNLNEDFSKNIFHLEFIVTKLQAFVFRCPIDTPVVTAFGVMNSRSAVFVRVEDKEGHVGWGEVWCNYPTVGAEHRALLIQSVFVPLLLGQPFVSPLEAFNKLTDMTAILGIQSAEQGPLAQCIAGIDIALWDMTARRAELPLWKLLGGESSLINVYASGLNPDQPEKLAALSLVQGHRAFKLKVGFGHERDVANLRALRNVVGDLPLMADANQSWTIDKAVEMAERFESFNLDWLEEPIRADRPWSEFKYLASHTSIGLAAGENIFSSIAFEHAIDSHALQVVQPDVAKWGGISKCLPIAKKIISGQLRYCPHYLGAGIGLRASAHLLAAVGGNGMLEVDANPNPLRTLMSGPIEQVLNGQINIGDTPGLGLIPDLQMLNSYAVAF
jgi:D-galactarolactone cycloisomerase